MSEYEYQIFKKVSLISDDILPRNNPISENKSHITGTLHRDTIRGTYAP